MVYVVSVTHHQPDGQSFQVSVHVDAEDPVAAVEAAVEAVREQLTVRGLLQVSLVKPPEPE